MRALAIITIFSLSTFAQQPKSGIQFWDTTGTNQTAKVGWTGDASNGNFYIEMPNNKNITAKDGNVSVTGEVTGTKFNGSGAGLTNLPETDPTVPAKIAAINDSLKRKADTTKVNPLWTGGATGQAWKKTATGYGWANDSVGSTGTAGVTQITPGAGVSVSPAGGTGNVTVNAKFAGTGSKDSVARSDHTHANYIGATGVTFENLNANGDVGANADQVAKGDHTHDSLYLSGINYYVFNDHIGHYYTITGENTVLSVTMNIPANGFVIVNASSSIQFVESATDMTITGLVTNKNSMAEDELFYTIYGDYQKCATFFQTKCFPVSPGYNTFRLILKKPTNGGSQRAWNSVITAFYSARSF